MIQGLLVSFNTSPMTGQATAMAVARGRERPPTGERLPGGLQLACSAVLKRYRLAETRHATMLDVGNGEPRMGPADVDRDEFH